MVYRQRRAHGARTSSGAGEAHRLPAESARPAVAARLTERDDAREEHAGGRWHAHAADKQQKDVTILDIYENAASVKVVAGAWIDYLHVARSDGRWQIVNVLWELKPQAP